MKLAKTNPKKNKHEKVRPATCLSFLFSCREMIVRTEQMHVMGPTKGILVVGPSLIILWQDWNLSPSFWQDLPCLQGVLKTAIQRLPRFVQSPLWLTQFTSVQAYNNGHLSGVHLIKSACSFWIWILDIGSHSSLLVGLWASEKFFLVGAIWKIYIKFWKIKK